MIVKEQGRLPILAGGTDRLAPAPIPLFYYPDIEQAVAFATESSKTTDGAEECLDACRFCIAGS